ncbi:MAG: hypothetical protein HC938_05885 [Nitrospira sp.]|nr:hypothetical protein [Nitrospira sp.]
MVRRLRIPGMSNSLHSSDRYVLVGIRHEKGHRRQWWLVGRAKGERDECWDGLVGGPEEQ